MTSAASPSDILRAVERASRALKIWLARPGIDDGQVVGPWAVSPHHILQPLDRDFGPRPIDGWGMP